MKTRPKSPSQARFCCKAIKAEHGFRCACIAFGELSKSYQSPAGERSVRPYQITKILGLFGCDFPSPLNCSQGETLRRFGARECLLPFLKESIISLLIVGYLNNWVTMVQLFASLFREGNVGVVCLYTHACAQCGFFCFVFASAVSS